MQAQMKATALHSQMREKAEGHSRGSPHSGKATSESTHLATSERSEGSALRSPAGRVAMMRSQNSRTRLRKMMRRGVNVLQRMRHALFEEMSIREKLKVSVGGQDLDFINDRFIMCNFRSKSTPWGCRRHERTRNPNASSLNFNLIKNGMSEPNNQSPFARLTRSSVHYFFNHEMNNLNEMVNQITKKRA